MKYYSLNNPQITASFQQAAVEGLAKDKGLYFPSEIPVLDPAFFQNIENLSSTEIALEVIKAFVGKDIPEKELELIVEQTLSFDLPVVKTTKDTYALELFHGPTLAFKDIGAGFMSRCLRSFVKDTDKKVTVLVATSGDTGSAVANGFYKVKGVDVVILYPKGKVSAVQEKQLTTLGENITALEVDGDFDLCQAMVKTAFLDPDLKDCFLTSANSINVARWLPQMFYYFLTYKQLKHLNKPIVVSVPSGNFGNICAGLLAKKMGLPIDHFVASTNVNDTIFRYLNQNVYAPNKTIETYSNAMDVSDPSNFVRIMALYNNDMDQLKQDLTAFSFTDEQTTEQMKSYYQECNYLLDPHASVGLLGLNQYKEQQDNKDFTGVYLATAHPIKFADCILEHLDLKVPLPRGMKDLLQKQKKSIEIKDYQELKQLLLERK